MKTFQHLLLVVASTLPALTGIAADSAMKSAEMAMEPAPMLPGLNVGDSAPDFTLKDPTGKNVSLDSLLAQGKVALVFYRSADWCPFCIGQLKELQAHLASFEQAGVRVVGISYDPVDVLARSAKKHGVTFPLLSDEGSKTIDAFGIRNLEAKGKGDGIPHPVIFILDQQGVIRAKLAHEDYKTRPTPAEIVAAAGSITMK